MNTRALSSWMHEIWTNRKKKNSALKSDEDIGMIDGIVGSAH